MAYELIGIEPKSSLGVCVRFNIVKWVHISFVLREINAISDFRRLIIPDGNMFDSQVAEALLQKLQTIGGRELGEIIDKTAPISTSDKGVVATYEDIYILKLFLGKSNGFYVT
jgi:hypothetical protein